MPLGIAHDLSRLRARPLAARSSTPDRSRRTTRSSPPWLAFAAIAGRGVCRKAKAVTEPSWSKRRQTSRSTRSWPKAFAGKAARERSRRSPSATASCSPAVRQARTLAPTRHQEVAAAGRSAATTRRPTSRRRRRHAAQAATTAGHAARLAEEGRAPARSTTPARRRGRWCWSTRRRRPTRTSSSAATPATRARTSRGSSWRSSPAADAQALQGRQRPAGTGQGDRAARTTR